ncbi:MAG: phosphoglycerate kinase [Gemmatimonadaceae bacterium]|nr:phosphoglycerate kinase [Gemmatimonadaceae bacterium]
MAKRSITSLTAAEVRGKRVLVRVDFNVPLTKDGRVDDDTRLRAALPTINALIALGGRVVLCSHLGRPKGGPDPKYSLAPVATRVGELLKREVRFCAATVGPVAEAASRALGDGDVLLLENTRFEAGEEKNDPALSRAFAALGDLYVNDAFGSAHRAHASTEGVARLLKPAVAGLLMEKELAFLGNALEHPKHPFVAILGGSKISGKIDVIEALLPKVDALLVGGAMACTFYKAMELETGTSLVEPDRVEMAEDLIERSGTILILPHDATVAPGMDQGAKAHAVKKDAIPKGEAMLDIGPDSAASYARAIQNARTVLWNGPMGVFETKPFDAGTNAIANAMAAATKKGAITIVGGGDSASAVERAGLASQMSHVSTGGGASLEFLEGKLLPGVEALNDA